MATKAQSGLGSLVKIGAVTIGEIQSIKQSGCKWDTEEATNLASTAKEFVPTIIDWGEFQVSAKRVSTDAGQLAVVAAFGTGASSAFSVTLLKEAGQVTTGDIYTFNGIVTELSIAVDATKLTPLEFKIKVSGAVTFVEGA
jgi:hypothetical protein